MSEGPAVSRWVRRFAPLIAPGGQVLDLACGSGRHLRWLHAQGFAVTGVDRDAAALAALRAEAAAPEAELIEADIENGAWPLPGRQFDGIVVTNYLWRPLAPRLLAALAPGGVLLHETFAAGHETLGRPRNPDFLLRPGELLQACAGLRVVAFEDGFSAAEQRFVQRIAAVRERPRADGEPPPRHGLDGPAG